MKVVACDCGARDEWSLAPAVLATKRRAPTLAPIYSGRMGDLDRALDDYIQLVESGQSLLAIEKYYADEVIVRENRTLSRAGKLDCLAFEKAMLQKSPRPPRIRAIGRAVDELRGKTFIEWRIRFVAENGHVMLLEEVAAAHWSHEVIIEERFYYEGFVDEGPADGEF